MYRVVGNMSTCIEIIKFNDTPNFDLEKHFFHQIVGADLSAYENGTVDNDSSFSSSSSSDDDDDDDDDDDVRDGDGDGDGEEEGGYKKDIKLNFSEYKNASNNLQDIVDQKKTAAEALLAERLAINKLGIVSDVPESEEVIEEDIFEEEEEEEEEHKITAAKALLAKLKLAKLKLDKAELRFDEFEKKFSRFT